MTKYRIALLGTIVICGLLGAGGCASRMRTQAAVEHPVVNKRKAMDIYMEGKVAENAEQYAQAATLYLEAHEYDPESEEIALALSLALIRDGKLRAAIRYARTTVAINPANVDAWQVIQRLEQHEGRYDKAQEALEMYMKLSDDVEFLDTLQLAWYLYEQKKIDEARSLLLETVRGETMTAVDLGNAAKFLEERGFSDDALTIYRLIVDRDPLDADGWFSLGGLYLDREQWTRGREVLEEGIAKIPDSGLLMAAAGNACLGLNDWDCAIAWFEKAMDAGVDATEIQTTLAEVYLYAKRDADALAMVEKLKAAGEDDARLYFFLGKAMNYLGRYEEAVDYFEQGFAKDTKQMNDALLFTSYRRYAGALVRLGRGDEALALVQTDAAQRMASPEDVKVLEASIYNALKRWEDAAAIFEWLSSSNPDDASYLFGLAQARSSAGQYDMAEKALLDVARIDPDNLGYLVQLSLVYDLSGDFKKAEKALLDVLKKEPDNALALNNLAYMYVEHDSNLSKALDMVGKALESEPGNGAYYDTLGWALYKKGDHDKAHEAIIKAIELEDRENSGVIYEHLGDVLAVMGRVDEAAQAYTTAIEIGEAAGRIQPKIDGLDK